MTLDYADFLARKAQLSNAGGFVPTSMPAHLFDYQVRNLAAVDEKVIEPDQLDFEALEESA